MSDDFKLFQGYLGTGNVSLADRQRLSAVQASLVLINSALKSEKPGSTLNDIDIVGDEGLVYKIADRIQEAIKNEK